MQIVMIVAIIVMGCMTAAQALVPCDDAVSVRQRAMDEFCLPTGVSKQHDAECVSVGLNRETERYLTCRKSKAEMYRNRELLEKMQAKSSL